MHETGIKVSVLGGARIVRFRTRFCLAPASSSPSNNNTGNSPRFTKRSSGTEPASLTSKDSATPEVKALVERKISLGLGVLREKRNNGQIAYLDGFARAHRRERH